MKKRIKNELAYKLCTPLMRLLFRIFYNPKIVNKGNVPKTGPIIIASNHKHVWDQCFAIMGTKRVLHYFAKKEYFEGKLAWFFKLFCCISVNRDGNDDEAVNKAKDILSSGGAIGIFPEGTRNKTYDQILLPLKYGTVSLAYKTKAKIIPVAVTGDYKFRPKNMMVRFGDPISVEDKDYEKYNNMLRDSIISLIKQNLSDTNRTMEEELYSRNQDQK